MEINVTAIVASTKDRPCRFSASVAETGLANIGQITWKEACEQRAFAMSGEELQAWLDYVPEYGAWDDEEIAAWSKDEATALFVQFVSGDYRNLCNCLDDLGYDREDFTDEQFREATENEGGNLYRHKGEWFYYVGM